MAVRRADRPAGRDGRRSRPNTYMPSRFCRSGGFLSGLRKRRGLLFAVRNWPGALKRSVTADVTLALPINFDENPITRYVEELTNRALCHIDTMCHFILDNMGP